MRKSKKTTKALLDVLSDVPNISFACKKLGISRQTFYRWKNTDSSFSDLIDDHLTMGREYISDIAESRLAERINLGEMSAIRYWLGNNSKRYIKPRSPISVSHDKVKLPSVNVNFKDFSEKDVE